MVNHFRTLLLNLSDAGTESEFITKGFAARVLPGELLKIYSILFPGNRASKLLAVQSYLEIIKAANLEEAFTLVDNRISYNLDTDFKNFKSPSINLVNVLNQLNNSGAVNKMLALPKLVDNDKYDNLWLFHTNPIYKLAGLLVAYTIRLS